MKKNFIFIKNNNDTFIYYLSFIPLIIYGLYKNGYLLMTNNYISFFDAYKIIFYPIGCFVIGLLFTFIFKKRRSQVLSFAITMGIVAPYNFNMVLYFGVVLLSLFLVEFIPNKYKINEASMLITILIFVNYFSNQFSIFNPMEFSSKYSYSLVDLFFGRGASYLFTSSIFLIIISYFILSFSKTYKKEIPLISFSIFLVLAAIYMITTKSYLNNIKLFLNGTTFFSFVYLSTTNVSSPSTKNITYIYGTLVGLLSFVFIYLFDIYTGSIVSIFIVSVFYRIYELIRQKIFLKNF